MAVQATDPFRDVVRISRARFVALLSNSPAASAASAVYDYAVQRGVDPLFVLAIFRHESQFGKAGWAAKTKSWGNTRPPSFGVYEIGAYQQDSGQYTTRAQALAQGGNYSPRSLCAYKDWYDGGISTVARLVEHVYKGRTQIRGVFDETLYPNAVWAPAGDMNNPAGYLASVLSFMSSNQDMEGKAAMQQFADTIKELTPGSNRPGDRLLGFDAFVVHETDNENNGAGAENTYQYLMGTYNNKVRPGASFHFVTDGLKGGHSYQLLPAGPKDAEACWAIGDGQDQADDASNRTVSGEICVNKDGDYDLAVRLMAKIAARVLKAHGKTPVKNVTLRQHGSYWSARNPSVHKGCPKHIQAGDWGWTWDRFCAQVATEYNALALSGGSDGKVVLNPTTPVTPAPVKETAMQITVPGRGEAWIVEPILTYWQDCGGVFDSPNALGYPVTGMYAKPDEPSVLVQWFERGRVEVRGSQISSALVGAELAEIFAPNMIINHK